MSLLGYVLAWVTYPFCPSFMFKFQLFIFQLLQEERLDGATLLILANKQDLPGAARPEEIQQLLDLDNIKTHHWSIRACSAIDDTTEHLQKALYWLTEDIASRCFTKD